MTHTLKLLVHIKVIRQQFISSLSLSITPPFQYLFSKKYLLSAACYLNNNSESINKSDTPSKMHPSTKL